MQHIVDKKKNNNKKKHLCGANADVAERCNLIQVGKNES
jgi:hypothetical protein